MRFCDYLEKKDITQDEYSCLKMDNVCDTGKLPKRLLECDCCSRHAKDFPMSPDWARRSSCTNAVNNCPCPCRHVARFLCMQLEYIETLQSETESSETDSSGSLEDFIVPDKGMRHKERKKLNKILHK